MRRALRVLALAGLLLAWFQGPALSLCDHGPPATFTLPAVPLPRENDAVWFSARYMTQHLATGILTASGSVRVTLGPLLLGSDEMTYDRRANRGELSGHVVLDAGPYVILTDRLDVDGGSRRLSMGPFHGQASGEANFWGQGLEITPTRVTGKGLGYSPCLCPDPGYYVTVDRMDFTPHQQQGHNLIARGIALHAGSLTIFYLPYFETRVGKKGIPRPWLPFTLTLPAVPGNGRFSTTAGYDAYQGPWVEGDLTDHPAPGNTLRVPLRVSLFQGPSIFGYDALSWGGYQINSDAGWSYPWVIGQGGPSAGVTVSHLVDRTNLTAAVGYRTPLLGHFVHQLPQVTANFPALQAASLSVVPEADLGYLSEEVYGTRPNTAMRGNVGLSASWPLWSPGPWLQSQLFGNGSETVYPGTGQSQQGVTSGLRETLTLGPLKTYGAYQITRQFGTTPFFFDGIYPNDQVFGGAFLHLNENWGTGVDLQFYRARFQGNAPANGFDLAFLNFTLAYRVNCLWWQVHFNPLIDGISLDYRVTTF